MLPTFTAPIGKPLYRRAPGLFVLLSGTSFQAFHALLRALESELGPCVTQWNHPQSLWLELLDLWSLLAARGGPRLAHIASDLPKACCLFSLFLHLSLFLSVPSPVSGFFSIPLVLLVVLLTLWLWAYPLQLQSWVAWAGLSFPVAEANSLPPHQPTSADQSLEGLLVLVAPCVHGLLCSSCLASTCGSWC